MLVNIEDKQSKLIVSFINKKGNIELLDIPLSEKEKFIWVETNRKKDAHPTIKSWNEKKVKKVPSKYLNKYRIEEVLLKQPKHIKDKIYEMNIPNLYFCDIEVEITDEGFPHPHLAKNKVTSISYSHKNKVISLGTKKLSNEDIKLIEKDINNHFKDYYSIEFEYRYFESEYDMLYTFFNDDVQKMPLITGWYFTKFDWPYLINRCKILNIDTSVVSPTRKMKDEMIPYHRIVVDYLQVYKKWDRTVSVKENDSLDFVSKQVLGINKIKYNGTLQDLYEQDFRKYIFYNAVDALLVQLIHEKIQTINTWLMLANITKVEVLKAFSTIWMTESVMVKEFYKENKVIPKQENIKDKKREYYEGAYVFSSNPGLYEWVASFDFASLYPSIMRQWNISPENYVMNTDEDVDKEKYIKTSSGAVFKKEKDSVFRKILTEYYGKRKSTKQKMFQIEKEIAYLKEILEKK